MKTWMVVVAVGLVAVGCQSGGGGSVQEDPHAKAKMAYSIQGDYVEACECSSPCPCSWMQDATGAECRAIGTWNIAKGYYGKTDLSGTSFAVALTKLGKNVAKNAGNWEGILYISANASPAQKDALVDILSSNFGKFFKKDGLQVKTAPIEFKKEGEKREIRIGQVATIQTTPLRNSHGKVPVIENAPMAMVVREHLAKADKHTFKDGGVSWDFAGQNSFYGPFNYYNME